MKNILFYIVGIPILSFIIFQIAFIFNWAIVSFILLFFPKDYAMTHSLFMPIIETVIVIGLIILFRYGLKSKLPLIFKSSLFAILLGFIYSLIGMSFYQWPLICYSVGILFFILVTRYLYKRNQSWVYFYVAILMSVIMLFITLLRIDI